MTIFKKRIVFSLTICILVIFSSCGTTTISRQDQLDIFSPSSGPSADTLSSHTSASDESSDYSDPAETTIPTTSSTETTAPLVTTVPSETTASVETTFPAEITSPVETTAPPEITSPAEITFPPETTSPVETTAPLPSTDPILDPYDLDSHTIGSMNYAVMEEINAQRTAAGLSELSFNETLSKIASVRSYEVSVLWSHTRPDGTDCFSALSDYGYSGYHHAGENLLNFSGNISVQDIVGAWMNSEGHRKNILSPDFTATGLGIWESGGVCYLAQFFTD